MNRQELHTSVEDRNRKQTNKKKACGGEKDLCPCYEPTHLNFSCSGSRYCPRGDEIRYLDRQSDGQQ